MFAQASRDPFIFAYFYGRYRIEQELGTEIKPIPPQIDRAIYCS